jgi:drug/metabolite transporter (DMT)-like permease
VTREPAPPGLPPLAAPPPRDLALIAVAVAAVSTSAPLIAATVAPALAVAFWRNALASAVLVPAVAGRPQLRREVARLDPAVRRTALLAGVSLAAHFATWVPSLRYTSVASATALVATQPVWAALIARSRGHRLPRSAWAGIVLAIAGVGLLTGFDVTLSARALLGDGLALAGAVFAAGYVTAGGSARQHMTTSVYTALCYSTAALLLLALCVATGAPLHGYPDRTWLEIVALTLGAQLLGHSVFNIVLASTSPTAVSLSILFEVPGATLIAALFLHQRLHLYDLPAGALLLVGIAVVVRAGARAQPLE